MIPWMGHLEKQLPDHLKDPPMPVSHSHVLASATTTWYDGMASLPLTSGLSAGELMGTGEAVTRT
jgi:hypothetical protein